MSSLRIKKVKILTLFFIIIFSLFIPTINSSKTIDEKQNIISFDTKLKIFMKAINLPSAVVCIIKNNSVAFMKPYGYSNFYSRKKATNDTIYLLGSVSKTITATALMQLYDKGYFKLDDAISDYLPFDIKNPWYPEKQITFRMILSHQASFNDFGIRLRFLPFMLPEAWLKNDSHNLIKEMLTPGGKVYNKWFFLRAGPGEKALYDEIGFVLAGYLVELISSKTLEEYCQENIFKPLGMNNTSFYIDKFNKKQIAQPYVSGFNIYSPLPKYNLFFLDPPAGLYTKAEDLTRFFISHMNNGVYENTTILKEETAKIMHTKQYPNSHDVLLGLMFRFKAKVHHGLGWFFINLFGLDLEGHTGGAPGYSCHMYMFNCTDGEKAGLIVLSNGPMLFPALISTRVVIKGYEGIIKLLIEKANNL